MQSDLPEVDPFVELWVVQLGVHLVELCEVLPSTVPGATRSLQTCMMTSRGSWRRGLRQFLIMQTLYSKWEEEGAAWVQMQPSARFGHADSIPSRSVRLSPEQLSLIDRHFDEVTARL